VELTQILQKRFSFDKFRTGQKEVISSVLSGQHTLAMLPTGTGKSLCYQLPGYLLKGQVLIISPLLSLMQDQVEQMKMKGEKRVIAINSFLSFHEKQEVFSKINHFKYIFLSPEMLALETVVKVLQKLNVSLFVIDEAHCISQWGYDFRPDYLKLGAIRKKLGNPVTLALTATATNEIRKDIMNSLEIDDWQEIIYSVDRENIAITVEKLSDPAEKLQRLHELVKSLQGPGIIYFSSKRLAEQTASVLHERGIKKVMAYHGGMEQEQRILIQQQFVHGQLDVICATSAFGMGINKEKIRYIIHYHMPLQIESYLQEIGRAGRDGTSSIAILLFTPGDEVLATQLSQGELPAKEQIQYLYSLLKEQSVSRMNPNQIVDLQQMTGLTDIQWRIVSDFITFTSENITELDRSMSMLMDYVEERLRIKRSKIQWMLNWIHSDCCRREAILHYFAEERNRITSNCCDHCGVDFDSFIKQELTDSEEKAFYDWKRYLSQILLK
jgi:ATP-dependent DNA helicase RecQ